MVNQVYPMCNSGTSVELVKHIGGVHEWPIDQYFNTTDYILKFFARLG